VERSWSRAVRESSKESSTRGPAFSVPFVPPPVQVVPSLAHVVGVASATPVVSACFLEYSEEIGHMEEELRRAVMVTIIGSWPHNDMADAALVLHREFNIGPSDMSIRAFSQEDFLVLCCDARLRDRMVTRGGRRCRGFPLPEGVAESGSGDGGHLSYLVPLELLGVPGHVWHRRMAEAVLDDSGFVWMWRLRLRVVMICRDSRFGCGQTRRSISRRVGFCSSRSRRCDRGVAASTRGRPFAARQRCCGTSSRSDASARRWRR
jgi:hypothetical protein